MNRDQCNFSLVIHDYQSAKLPVFFYFMIGIKNIYIYVINDRYEKDALVLFSFDNIYHVVFTRSYYNPLFNLSTQAHVTATPEINHVFTIIRNITLKT